MSDDTELSSVARNISNAITNKQFLDENLKLSEKKTSLAKVFKRVITTLTKPEEKDIKSTDNELRDRINNLEGIKTNLNLLYDKHCKRKKTIGGIFRWIFSGKYRRYLIQVKTEHVNSIQKIFDSLTIQKRKLECMERFHSIMEKAPEELADVTLEIDGISIMAHKAILAGKTKHFNTQLAGVREYPEEEIEISDEIASPEAFAVLLQYLYYGTNEPPISKDLYLQVMCAANYFGVDDLKDKMELSLVDLIKNNFDEIDDSSVINLLEACYSIHFPTLAYACLDHISNYGNINRIKKSDEFNTFLESHKDFNILLKYWQNEGQLKLEDVISYLKNATELGLKENPEFIGKNMENFCCLIVKPWKEITLNSFLVEYSELEKNLSINPELEKQILNLLKNLVENNKNKINTNSYLHLINLAYNHAFGPLADICLEKIGKRGIDSIDTPPNLSLFLDFWSEETKLELDQIIPFLNVAKKLDISDDKVFSKINLSTRASKETDLENLAPFLQSFTLFLTKGPSGENLRTELEKQIDLFLQDIVNDRTDDLTKDAIVALLETAYTLHLPKTALACLEKINFDDYRDNKSYKTFLISHPGFETLQNCWDGEKSMSSEQIIPFLIEAKALGVFDADKFFDKNGILDSNINSLPGRAAILKECALFFQERAPREVPAFIRMVDSCRCPNNSYEAFIKNNIELYKELSKPLPEKIEQQYLKPKTKTPPSKPPPQYTPNFSFIYGDEKIADLKITQNGNDLLNIHKSILASKSHYFKTMFISNPKTAELDLKDISPKAFKKIIEFLYTDNIEELEADEATEIVLNGTQFFTFPEDDEICSKLRACIEIKLIQTVNNENILKLIEFSSTRQYPNLLQECQSILLTMLLSGEEVKGSDIEHQAIKTLDLSHSEITDSDFGSFLSKFSKLEEINISGCSNISQYGIIQALERHNAPIEVISDIKQLALLFEIYSRNNGITPDGIQLFRNMQWNDLGIWLFIKVFKKTDPSTIPEDFFSQLTSLSKVSAPLLKQLTDSLPNIRNINIGKNSDIKDEDLIFISKLQTLNVLSLEDCRQLTGSSIAKALESSINLKILNLNNTNISGDDLLSIVKKCPLLSEIRINNCPHISVTDIKECAKISPNLNVIKKHFPLIIHK